MAEPLLFLRRFTLLVNSRDVRRGGAWHDCGCEAWDI